MQESFDKRLTPATMREYFEHLAPFDAMVVDKAVRRAIVSRDRFPSIADLRQACLSEQRARVPFVVDDGVEAPAEIPRDVLEFCAAAGMPWARQRLEEAA